MKRRGFTLVELILALGLFALLALFITGVLRSVLGIWQASERRGRGDLAFAGVVEAMRADLAALHTGPLGWLVLDEWEALPAAEDRPAWRLPRLRFLARGSVLGRPGSEFSAAEVAWLVVPEEGAASRLTRLVRIAVAAQPGGDSLRNEATLRAMLGRGLVVLDGVAELGVEVLDTDGRWTRSARVPPETALDFPARVRLRLERVAGNARRRPPVLDADLGLAGADIVVRGSPPLALPEFGLLGGEWVRLAGDFPRLRLVERGLRGSAPAGHARGTPLFLPEAREATFRLPAAGRRLP